MVSIFHRTYINNIIIFLILFTTNANLLVPLSAIAVPTIQDAVSTSQISSLVEKIRKSKDKKSAIQSTLDVKKKLNPHMA